MEAKKASHRQVLRRLQDRIFDLIFTVRWKGWGQSPFDSAPFGKLRASRARRPDPMIGSSLRPAVTLTEMEDGIGVDRVSEISVNLSQKSRR